MKGKIPVAESAPRLTRQRREAIAALAESVASRYKEGRVEPEAIAAQEQIAFRYASFPEDFDGILLHEDGRFFIVCNESRAERGSPRSRFTLAHELGHYFLAEHREALASGRMPPHFSLAEHASNQPVEKEADLFAANLLMPSTPFWIAAGAHPDGVDQIAALAAAFGTSLTATAFRALELEIFPAPAAVFRWDALGRRTVQRMSWATFVAGGDLQMLADEPPEDSLTARAIRDASSGQQSGSIDGAAWFPGLGSSPKPALLREEVISLGQYGWLTLVWQAGPDRSDSV